MGTYIWITVAVTEWRTKFRREMNTRDNAIRQKATDSLLNAETVKLYSGEEFEAKTYLDKILDYQQHEWRSLASLALLNVSQSTVIAVGLAGGAMLCGYEVSQGERTVGDFVMFITYVAQLYAPLNWFGTYFRMIQAAFVDMENMIDLFAIKPSVVDKEGALPLVPSGEACGIEFSDVSFA
jgi:ABC-type transport system involved in Fe-S cluster assembly fused permease/ATPase subunit